MMGKKFTVSIRIAEFYPEMENVQRLIKEADIALYDAKQSGCNQIFYNQQKHQSKAS